MWEMRNKWIKKIKVTAGEEKSGRLSMLFVCVCVCFMSWKGLLVLDWPPEAGSHSAIKRESPSVILPTRRCVRLVISKVLSPSPRRIRPTLLILCHSNLHFSLSHISPFFSKISFSSFHCVCLQLPSPTAMSTALRGISCYLREVTTWLVRLVSVTLHVCLSVCLSLVFSCLRFVHFNHYDRTFSKVFLLKGWRGKKNTTWK